MKKLVSILFIIMAVISSFAQPYGNEWINYDQQYLKFQIVQDGIYRIDYSTLTAGLNKLNENLSNINPKNFQLFGRGKELFIHIEGESDNSFDANDYIEFYAEKNDGWLDAYIYDKPSSQNNPHYSLFNDTATYYITWNTSVLNKRMTVVDDQNFNVSASPYFMKKLIDFGTNSYWNGWYNSEGKSDVSYTGAEGYYYTPISGIGATKTISFNTENAYTGAGAPDVKVNTIAAGVNDPDGAFDHQLQISYKGSGSDVILYDTIFSDFVLMNRNFTFSASNIGSSTTTITYKNGNSSNSAAKTGISNTEIYFAHTYNLEGASKYTMYIPANTSKTYLDISNFSSNTTSSVYDLTEHYKIKTTQSGNNIDANIPPGNSKKLYITTDNNIQSIFSLQPVTKNGFFRNYIVDDPDSVFIAITHPAFFTNAITYNAYRASITGGNHDTLTVNINELYDQFAYGINKNPLSIRNFANYLLNNLTTAPQNIFLVGKSLWPVTCRTNTNYYKNCYVPTIGNPPTDILFTAGLNGNYYEPTIPVGRLAARSTNDVELYLNKIKSLESEQNKAADPLNLNFHDVNGISNKGWMKEVAHFGGGSNSGQQTTFKYFLDTYKATIEGDLYGGHVNSVFKASSAVIEPNLADTIKGWVENGLSLITFFGHSSAQGFDVSLDDPQFYDNKNKYPLFIANGCFSGDIHNLVTTSILPSSSEKFVLADNAGAIGFIASVGTAYDNMLHAYTKVLYEKIAKDNYGQSIGQCMKACANDMINASASPNSFAYRDVILQMGLHGDPSVKVNTHPLPDYYIDEQTVFFTPNEVNNDLSEFSINIVTYNLGKAVTDDVTIYVERTYDGGIDTTIITKPQILFNDTTTVTYTIDENSPGLNQFRIYVDWAELDSRGNIDEVSETNNSINFPPIDLWIGSSDLIPIYPYNYAIIPDTSVILKASTADLFAEERTYKLQLDTTDTYDSYQNGPIESFSITQSGGVVHWDPTFKNINVQDSMVFFWRAAPEGSDKWREHSFQYIVGKTGWSQDHFFQFKNDEYQYIDYNRTDRTFDLIDVMKRITCKTIQNVSNNDLWSVEYRIDGTLWDNGAPCGTPVMIFAVIDPVTLVPWQSYTSRNNPNGIHKYGQWDHTLSCFGRTRPDNYFLFRPTSQAELDTMVNFMYNVIPDGYYILAYSAKQGNFQSYWQPKHFQPFIDMGADSASLVNLGNDIPYIFFTQKGDNSKTVEVKGSTPGAKEEIFLNNPITSSANWGNFTSTLIGPAYRWDSLHWNFQGMDAGTQDSIFVQVYGRDWDGNETKLKSYYIGNQHVRLTTDIDASKYPYIYLNCYVRDDVQKTALQLGKWQVIYEEIPEAALDPNVHFYMNSDTLYAGQDLAFSIAVENVSRANMDSLRISYIIENQYGNYYNQIEKNAPLLAGNIFKDTLNYQVLGNLAGANKLYIDVNPIDSLWQLEQYHFNNKTVVNFNVDKDKTNPLLDVTFDGIHILNGDIVSSKPEIFIELKDENQFMALDDTSDFFIYITDPNGNTEKVPFTTPSGKEVMYFSKGELPENKASISWNPHFVTDGIYKMSVQGRDASNNLSGDNAYMISFEVVNKSTITHLMNYPNPFTTNTRFVFTLTGSVIPDVFKIQILTVSGKVVREVTKDELGNIHIGRNITEYAWDGTDEFGDLLANGVYLYRVITKIQGEEIELRQSGADDFFVKDFGKMYIMR